MIALILVAGDMVVTPRLLRRVQQTSTVIAADGGARHAQALGMKIDLWVGDFDSSDTALQNQLADVPRLQHPRDKDQVDFELALTEAKRLGANAALVVGAFGGRFDHSLTIALIAARETQQGFTVWLESGLEAGWVLHGPCGLDLPTGTTFSLIALQTMRGLSLSGAKWPLGNATLEPGVGLGMSNVALGRLEVRLEEGLGLLIAEFA